MSEVFSWGNCTPMFRDDAVWVLKCNCGDIFRSMCDRQLTPLNQRCCPACRTKLHMTQVIEKQQVLNEWHREYRKVVRNSVNYIFRAYSHAPEQDEVVDLIQEIWKRIAQRYDRFDPDSGTPRSWISTLARNHVRDYLKLKIAREKRESKPISLTGLENVLADPSGMSVPVRPTRSQGAAPDNEDTCVSFYDEALADAWQNECQIN